MRKQILLTVLALLGCCTAVRADVQINEANFPDENFRKWVLSQDYGQDGVLTDAEIAGVTEINVNKKKIQSLKGIEYFTALTTLDCGFNQLTALNLSKNTALKELDCGENRLTALDVSKNTALTTLSCGGNQLTKLDLSQNTKLTELGCDWNRLTALNLSKNTALTELECGGNQLTVLDMSQNTALTTLHCFINQLTKLDVTKNTALTTLNCNSNRLRELDVSQNTALTSLYCDENQLTKLDLTKNTKLTWLDCCLNQIKGAAMDALVESLPKVRKVRYSGEMCVIYFKNEGNEMTTTQVAAAKAKGWTPYARANYKMKKYKGSSQ